ncbi:hypothetical protein EDO6_02764 [Paenibacillus xylanexedens]|nr:hypothetical protein EDO6_02764 [Paenibacillus xylanexedens]
MTSVGVTLFYHFKVGVVLSAESTHEITDSLMGSLLLVKLSYDVQ